MKRHMLPAGLLVVGLPSGSAALFAEPEDLPSRRLLPAYACATALLGAAMSATWRAVRDRTSGLRLFQASLVAYLLLTSALLAYLGTRDSLVVSRGRIVHLSTPAGWLDRGLILGIAAATGCLGLFAVVRALRGR